MNETSLARADISVAEYRWDRAHWMKFVVPSIFLSIWDSMTAGPGKPVRAGSSAAASCRFITPKQRWEIK